MKKKLLAVLLLAAFASLAFAQYGPPPSHGGGGRNVATYLSASFAVPIQWQNQSYRNVDVDMQTVCVGVGIDMTAFFTRHVGLHISADFYFPQTMKATYNVGNFSFSENIDMKDYYDSDWGFSVLVGPSFALLRTPRILFALAPGLHYYLLYAETGRASTYQYAIGLGINAEFMFNATRLVFVRAAIDLSYDFWGAELYYNGLASTSSDINRAINFIPTVGIGVRL